MLDTSNEMPLAIFITDAGASHIYASMGVARALINLGVNVEYWGSPKARHLIESQGFRFRQVDGLLPRFPDEIRLPRPLSAPIHPVQVMRQLIKRRRFLKTLHLSLNQAEMSIGDLVSRLKPKIVLFDAFLLAYYPLFWLHSVPTAVLSTKPLAFYDPIVPPYTAYFVPRRNRFSRFVVLVCWAWSSLTEKCYRVLRCLMGIFGIFSHRDVVTRIARRTRFPLHKELLNRSINRDLHFKSNQEWVLWTPEMDFPRVQSVPNNVRYIGPCVDFKRREPALSVDSRILSRKYIIYVAVGTVRVQWQANANFLAKVVEAFQDSPDIGVIISTGDDRTTKALEQKIAKTANIVVSDFFPQLAVLEFADLAVTHGGAGTYRECIMQGVPMLVYPRAYDQLGNSARIVFHGIGLRGNRKRDKTATIKRKALQILLDETFHRNIERLRQQVEKQQPALLASAIAAVTGDSAMRPEAH